MCLCVCVCVCVWMYLHMYTHIHTLSTLSVSHAHTGMLLESSLSECVKGRAWGVRHATAVDIEVKLNKPSWGQQQVVLLASLSEEDKEACLKAFTGETCYKCRPADDHVFYLLLQKPKLP